jgi:hydroxypyruvate isomerase
MKPFPTVEPLSRRGLLRSTALSPFAFAAQAVRAAPTPPPYTLSINIEVMFPRDMPRPERMRVVIDHGVKAYGTRTPASPEEERAMLKLQEQAGLPCTIVNGSGGLGDTTGLTAPGHEKEYLEELTEGIKLGQRLGAQNANTFVGQYQENIPWEVQRKNVIEGLKRAADIAGKHNVTLTLEPLYTRGPRHSAIRTSAVAYDFVEAIGHPNVRVCFDLYHLQQTEGNLTRNMKLGLDKGWINIIQIGDVPGRNEPGTGEINHPYIFHTLREIGYSGYLDTEHGTTTTPGEAIEIDKKMILEN